MIRVGFGPVPPILKPPVLYSIQKIYDIGLCELPEAPMARELAQAMQCCQGGVPRSDSMAVLLAFGIKFHYFRDVFLQGFGLFDPLQFRFMVFGLVI